MATKHLPDWVQLIQVFSKAVDRMKAGSEEYGEYDPATDTRDMYQEAQEEVLDVMVYMGMEYLRLEEMRGRYSDM